MRYVSNPPNPWSSESVEWLGEPPEARLEVYEETETRRIITRNTSPDIGFDYSVNCYRGCTHACSYCFSRPTHEYLGFGAGTDFETKIVAKVRAPELLRAELERPSWRGDLLVFSFTSDPYLPLEVHYRLTRRCLEVCLEYRQPVSIVTKSALVRRDKDLLRELAEVADCSVHFSIPFRDREISRALEPFAAPPESRFRAMSELAEAGIPVGIGIAPVIPGLNDSDIPELLRRASEAGARTAWMTMLRLPGSVAPYFEARLRERLPTRAERILNHIREERGGKLYTSEFGARMKGTSEQWRVAERLFEVYCRKLGLNGERTMRERRNTFCRSRNQGVLFD
ncbi:PA0069 family radical SAM protein [Pyrinomonas methylaliphatogenes]|jgi:DNA repair photolyase|uniref:DNA repair photolyase n=1 Tax=Pyrinomonas methylaliphatogenes TaxID=454194 RepID=A0A0B6WXH7_9BACT|nr:PA0069 family radical SAM protein [Pyrinomonas methylaliphatogenes]MBX5478554.1 PA0069 family radical SAM protein [Pyrinomonas methylaliphatogenes]CDM64880.1 DNA repair photolyase [Pyrinomonas methylaliphatogenes]